MQLYDINDPNRFYTLVVRDHVYAFLEILKKDHEWKINKKNLNHLFLKFHLEKSCNFEVYIDDYFLPLTNEEQEAINYEADKTYSKCENNLHKISYEKLIQELEHYKGFL